MQVMGAPKGAPSGEEAQAHALNACVTVCHIAMRRIEGEFAVLVGCAARPHPGQGYYPNFF